MPSKLIRRLSILLALLPLAAGATDVSKVRFDTKSDKTRLVFEVTGKSEPYIEQQGKLISLSFGEPLNVTTPAFPRVKAPAIESVRQVGDRVEITLSNAYQIDAFTLPPRDQYPTRVVIDILKRVNSQIASDPDKQSIASTRESAGKTVAKPTPAVRPEAIKQPTSNDMSLANLRSLSQRLQTKLMADEITLQQAITQTKALRAEISMSNSAVITEADIDLLDGELFALEELKSSLASLEKSVEQSRQDAQTLEQSQVDVALQKASVVTSVVNKLAITEAERKAFLEGLAKTSNEAKQRAAQKNRELLRELDTNREESVAKAIELIELGKATAAETAYIQQRLSDQVQIKLAELAEQQEALSQQKQELVIRLADLELKEKTVRQRTSELDARESELDKRAAQNAQTNILVSKPVVSEQPPNALTADELNAVSVDELLSTLRELAKKSSQPNLYLQRAATIDRVWRSAAINDEQASKILTAQIRILRGG